MHNRCPGHMVLCKITRVISVTSSSNGYYHNRHSAYSLLNSLLFQSVFCRQIKGIARELSKFHAIRQRYPRVTQISCNPHKKRSLPWIRQQKELTANPADSAHFAQVLSEYSEICMIRDNQE